MGGNMKNYNQVYVKNSFEAAEMYCKAFGAKITFEVKNDDKTAYAHCELSVDGEGFLALSEAANPCEVDLVHKMRWQTMTFNVFEMGSEESVSNAFSVLSDGGVCISPIHEVPWSRYCATVIDRFGVCWWISI
jgi:PhnB protein